jgi:hypothetical protein
VCAPDEDPAGRCEGPEDSVSDEDPGGRCAFAFAFAFAFGAAVACARRSRAVSLLAELDASDADVSSSSERGAGADVALVNFRFSWWMRDAEPGGPLARPLGRALALRLGRSCGTLRLPPGPRSELPEVSVSVAGLSIHAQ